MSLITLKLTSTFPNIFMNVHKSVDYFNHLLGNQTNSQFYLETISNGFIYIFSNMSVLEALTIPFTKTERKRLENMGNHGIQFLFGDLFEKNPFPKEGIIINYEYEGEPQEAIKKRLIEYFNSYECADIHLNFIEPNNLQVIMVTLVGLRLYANRLSQILEKYSLKN